MSRHTDRRKDFRKSWGPSRHDRSAENESSFTSDSRPKSRHSSTRSSRDSCHDRKPRYGARKKSHRRSKSLSPSPSPSKRDRHIGRNHRESRSGIGRRKSHYDRDHDTEVMEDNDSITRHDSHDNDRDCDSRDQRRRRSHHLGSRTSSRQHHSRRKHSRSPPSSRRRRRSRHHRDLDRSRPSPHHHREYSDEDRYSEKKDNLKHRSSGHSRRFRTPQRLESSSSQESSDEHERDDRRRDGNRKKSGTRRRRKSKRSGHRRPKRRHSSSKSLESERQEQPQQEALVEVRPRAGIVSDDDEEVLPPVMEQPEPTKIVETNQESTKEKGSKENIANNAKERGAKEKNDKENNVKEKDDKALAKPSSSSKHNDDVGHYQGEKGSVLNDKYVVIQEVGVGTFGRVLECHDLTKADHHRRRRRRPHKSDTVAIKVVRNIKRYYKSARIEADILSDVNRKGGRGLSHCVILQESFSLDGHYCMVFESLGPSLYDFLKRQKYQPFPATCVQDFAKQLLETLELIHGFRLIHTDLKPENILLLNDREVKHKGCWIPESTRIKLIDFGGATYDDGKKSSIVNTRQYRAPEVILGNGWSMSSDLWSVGCILAELYRGDLLFATHDNVEHLALIERIVNPFPRWMLERAKNEDLVAEAFQSNKMHKAERVLTPESMSFVKGVRPLESIVYPEDTWFLSMLRRILVIDPLRRSTATECLNTPKLWTH